MLLLQPHPDSTIVTMLFCSGHFGFNKKNGLKKSVLFRNRTEGGLHTQKSDLHYIYAVIIIDTMLWSKWQHTTNNWISV